ncbi:hypothetical protein [Adlercreutzia caecimuris]|uniref:hypothetical protein n=1 Tax=Adlercreutzia caecimuris TaxID=671266 RepID=UPI00272C8195|nr:hypothetical protein [Adlercreutzia caecimuris]
MKRWSEEEDRLIEAYGHLGAGGVRNAIEAETGTRRTVEAVQKRASRIGATLLRYETCSRCGKRIPHMNTRWGICAECRYRDQVERHRKAEAVRRDVLNDSADAEEERWRRAAAAERQRRRRRERGRK